ncbi:MAG: phosphoribosylformylglycinamidine synthase subunit PurQ [Pseudomonadota bacterium]
MRCAVIVFPGSNCDRDLAVALEAATGRAPAMVWHQETDLPAVDLVALPGGFSYGDYLRSGAMAARSAIMQSVIEHAKRGGFTLGICNGFQLLTECGLLPGALMRNQNLKFICKDVVLQVETNASPLLQGLIPETTMTFPIAHHDGNYFADSATLQQLEDEERVAFRYLDNPNGSSSDIAGILSENKNVLGMMPHPERVIDDDLGGVDGARFFEQLCDWAAAT